MHERWTPAYDRLFQPDHHLATDPACKRWAWLDLCHMARWEDGVRIIGGTVVPLKRGEFVTSIRFLAERWAWSKSKVARFLDVLSHESVAKIETVRGTPHGTVYRVVSYDDYAHPRDSNGTDSGTRTGRGRDEGGTNYNKEQQGTSKSDAREGRESGPLPEDWSPHGMHDERAAALNLDVEAEAEAFRNHHLSHGNTRSNWNHAFYTWLGNATKYGPAPSSSGSSQFADSAMVVTDEEIERLYGR